MSAPDAANRLECDAPPKLDLMELPLRKWSAAAIGVHQTLAEALRRLDRADFAKL